MSAAGEAWWDRDGTAATEHVSGALVPWRFSSIAEEARAIRRSAALSALPHVLCHRVSGSGAFDLVDRLCTSPLFLRDGQLRQTLLLDDGGVPLADAFVGLDDDGFLLVTEGLAPHALAAHVERHRTQPSDGALADVTIEHVTESHTFLSLDGPFAWEVMAEIEGQGIIGFPYLSFYRPAPDRICFRAGKTGEYGYYLLVPRHEAEVAWDRLLDAGRAFDVVPAGIEALWSCALEAWFFNIHREGRKGLTPVELSLRWRLAHDKPYVGCEAVAKRIAEGPQRRVTAIRSRHELCEDDAITLGSETIGRVLFGAPSPTLGHFGTEFGTSPPLPEWAYRSGQGRGEGRAPGEFIAVGLLDVAYAHSGIDRFRVRGNPVRTVSAPFVQNLSLVVSPLRHTYRDPGSIPALDASEP